MEIGRKLREARLKSGMTQEQVAERIGVSRQSISNWENEKNYPDIISIIELSDLYEMSLDVLLKGDEKMIKHLEESTDIIKSNKRIVISLVLNMLLMAALILFIFPLSNPLFTFAGVAIILMIAGSILYQLIQKI
ncbi:MAG: helix-turn-helix transcriptional regulator [Tissierellia bacterium]|nr:helix-turn-helix transcriptional regulator [Tissierellia bacterium]